MLEHLGIILTVLGAALAVILPGYGSAKVVGRIGQAAIGVLTEDPEKFGQLLILQALPATQGIYGLLSFFIIMSMSGLFGGGAVAISATKGLLYFVSALPIIVVGLISALLQGKAAEAGVALVAKRPDEMIKALVLAAMVETFAILALLATVLAVFNLPGLNV